MSDIYNIKIGGVVFSAKVNKTDANYEQVNRQFILLEILSKTINSRKSGSEAWLQDDDRAYDLQWRSWLMLNITIASIVTLNISRK